MMVSWRLQKINTQPPSAKTTAANALVLYDAVDRRVADITGDAPPRKIAPLEGSQEGRQFGAEVSIDANQIEHDQRKQITASK